MNALKIQRIAEVYHRALKNYKRLGNKMGATDHEHSLYNEYKGRVFAIEALMDIIGISYDNDSAGNCPHWPSILPFLAKIDAEEKRKAKEDEC